jgi:putative N6-adenine-specific DNA methylase
VEENNQYVAKTFAGLEHLLAHELVAIGADDIDVHTRSVSFTGDKSIMYKANYLTRTSLRILKEIARFNVTGQVSLYEGVKNIDWSQYLNVDQTFAIDSFCNQGPFNNTMFISLKAKDAIVDQFREKFNKRPSIDKDYAQVRIDIHIYKEECVILLDSSGSSLHKRGYRLNQVAAPLKESLAAGLIMLSGWDKKSTFIDGMTGSGTFAVEAALMAKNVPAGYFRKEFGFENWIDFDRDLWNQIVIEGEKQIVPLECKIIGLDTNREAVKIARENTKEAGLRGEVEILNESFFNYTPPGEPGTVFLNPPYGERLEMGDDMIGFYKEIGDALKKNFSGYTAWVISSNLVALKNIGLKPSRRIPVFNGALESKFVKFELFRGSHRDRQIERKSNREEEEE